jgi:2,5-diamino-6-(ribosylamino)-4(3H)-pyrimidinone 5'-phosphate reductase
MKPRPYVICHMCTTIDGRILTERWGRLPAGQTGGELFDTTERKFGIPAWLVGTTTMREFASPSTVLGSATGLVERRDYLANPRARRFAIGADASGVLRFRKGDVNGDHVVLLITDRVSDDFLAHLQRAGVSYLFCGRRRIDLRTALQKIRRKLGLEHLLLEGGGTFNGAMLKAGLVDEISQVIVPVVDGGTGIASIFDLPGSTARQAVARLRALSHRTLPGSVHWFRYRVVRPSSRS